MSNDLVAIGKVRKAHGIKGEVAISFLAEDTSLLEGNLFLVPPSSQGETLQLKVARLRAHHGNVILAFEGMKTRNDAETLRNYSLCIPRSELGELDEDEVFLLDLPGLAVIVKDESGGEKHIGRIVSVDIPAGQMIWTIEADGGGEILFPAVEEFVDEIDLTAGHAIISPPPGLVELYLDGKEDGNLPDDKDDQD